MTERIAQGLYRIPVPLPGNPLKELNSYLLRGPERSLLLDTGFRQEPCRQALRAGLDELGVRPEETDIVLTHLHSDHTGLAPELAEAWDCAIYISALDRARLEAQQDSRLSWSRSDLAFAAEGFPQELLDHGAEINPARAMAPGPTDRYVSLENGQVLETGAHRLRAIHVPGHTPGQLCFWLEGEDILFTADHVLFDITPNITAWLDVEDSLGDYLDSLRAVRDLPVRLCLPGHRGRGELKPRVDSLLDHHRRRLDEALAAVRAHPGEGAAQLAGYMTWKIRADSWETFPPAQKWFAVGECMAHLDHLMAVGAVRREVDADGKRHYYAL